MDWIGLVGSQQEIAKINEVLNEMTGEMKRKTESSCNDTTVYISGNTASETMKIHHGADGVFPAKRNIF